MYKKLVMSYVKLAYYTERNDKNINSLYEGLVRGGGSGLGVK